ncbi:MAG: hypothetical protein ACK5XB_11910, partial [Rhodospirillales bacterium]
MLRQRRYLKLLVCIVSMFTVSGCERGQLAGLFPRSDTAVISRGGAEVPEPKAVAADMDALSKAFDGNASSLTPITYVQSGMGNVRRQCVNFFDALARVRRDTAFARRGFSIAGGATAAILGLAQASAKEIAITAVGFAAADQMYENWQGVMLFVPYSDELRTKTFEAMKAYEEDPAYLQSLGRLQTAGVDGSNATVVALTERRTAYLAALTRTAGAGKAAEKKQAELVKKLSTAKDSSSSLEKRYKAESTRYQALIEKHLKADRLNDEEMEHVRGVNKLKNALDVAVSEVARLSDKNEKNKNELDSLTLEFKQLNSLLNATEEDLKNAKSNQDPARAANRALAREIVSSYAYLCTASAIEHYMKLALAATKLERDTGSASLSSGTMTLLSLASRTSGLPLNNPKIAAYVYNFLRGDFTIADNRATFNLRYTQGATAAVAANLNNSLVVKSEDDGSWGRTADGDAVFKTLQAAVD